MPEVRHGELAERSADGLADRRGPVPRSVAGPGRGDQPWVVTAASLVHGAPSVVPIGSPAGEPGTTAVYHRRLIGSALRTDGTEPESDCPTGQIEGEPAVPPPPPT